MLIVDDRRAYRAIAGSFPVELGPPPVATTYAFHHRLARVLADAGVVGVLSRHADPGVVLDHVLTPRPDRLVVLDPTRTVAEAVRVGAAHQANLLLAELVGVHGAPVRVTVAGERWSEVMAAEGVDFAVVEA